MCQPGGPRVGIVQFAPCLCVLAFVPKWAWHHGVLQDMIPLAMLCTLLVHSGSALRIVCHSLVLRRDLVCVLRGLRVDLEGVTAASRAKVT